MCAVIVDRRSMSEQLRARKFLNLRFSVVAVEKQFLRGRAV